MKGYGRGSVPSQGGRNSHRALDIARVTGVALRQPAVQRSA